MNRRAKILLGVGVLLVAAVWGATCLVPNEPPSAPSRFTGTPPQLLLPQSRDPEKLPRGSQRREINGMEYYLVPLASRE